MNYQKQLEVMAVLDTQEFNMYKTKTNKLYISGSITGDPFNFKNKFKDLGRLYVHMLTSFKSV